MRGCDAARVGVLAVPVASLWAASLQPTLVQMRHREGGTGKVRFLVSRWQGKCAGTATCVPDPSLESCHGPLLSCSITSIPKPGGELGAVAGIYPSDGAEGMCPW